ncbi:MAG: DNA polymerase III subunit delta' [Candidatus Omnitrophota bacterium]|nr:MAG: DNA polymerase III subunit delta' [Candidatus Omnitrophota bacterium]
MAFKDIEGQERAIEFFRNSVNKERLAHAYLFLGAPGEGKALLARNLVKFLNCESPVSQGDVFTDCCDICASCRKIDNFNHPDVHWIERKGKSISIDDIRILQRQMSLKRYEGKTKVFIILEVRHMTEEAANSLLKTLEEPPDDSLIILTSSTLSGLLPTIISRCQIVKFYPLKLEKLKEILIQRYGLSNDEAHFLSAQAEGRIGRALSLKEEGALGEKNRLIESVSRFDRGEAAVDIFNIKDKKELARQIRYLLIWFRDILVFKAGLSLSSIINADRAGIVKSQAQRFDFEDLEEIIYGINEAQRMIEQNVNPKIVLEVMTRGIAGCRK